MGFKYQLAEASLESKAEIHISSKQLDQKKIEELQKHVELVNALDSWILVPDLKLVPELQKLALVVNKLYKFNLKTIFRGFDTDGRYQNSMGLTEKRPFSFITGERLKPEVKVGYTFQYKATNPISFSTDKSIAEAFGKVVVQAELPKTNYLVITDELSYIINKRRNLVVEGADVTFATQREIIVFGGQDLKCKVIRI